MFGLFKLYKFNGTFVIIDYHIIVCNIYDLAKLSVIQGVV